MPRSYRQKRRKQSADETRARIVAAARALLLSKDGFANFTMESIAREAGVSRMTVYNQFESKSALYEALADDIAARGKIRDNVIAAFACADARAGIGKLIEAFVHFWCSEPEILRKLRALWELDPEFMGAKRDEWRLEAIRTLMERARRQRKIRTSSRHVREIEAVFILTDFATCDALASAGYSERQIAGRIKDLASACLGFSVA